MSDLSSSVSTPAPRRTSRLIPAGLVLAVAALGFVAISARAQFAASAPTTPIHDTSPLHPPAGSKVAIVEFEDQQCPDCGSANPVLMAAVAKYNIPWVRHDFLIPGHNWSKNAAIYARWFETKSKKLSDDYRNYIFANQASIVSPAMLIQTTAKFAASQGIQLPFSIDPQGTFAAQVQADVNLGERVGIEHTPTIFVVTSGGKAPPYIEVTDRSRLYQILDAAIAATK